MKKFIFCMIISSPCFAGNVHTTKGSDKYTVDSGAIQTQDKSFKKLNSKRNLTVEEYEMGLNTCSDIDYEAYQKLKDKGVRLI